MSDPIRLAVLASGSGTNLQAFIDAIKSGELNAKIALVISDNPDAYALTRARKNKIPAYYVGREKFNSREDYELKMVKMIKEADADLVLLAGFMRLLSPVFLHHFPNRIMNIHPSLLPAFPGLDAQGQALEYGVKVTGCTVHFVDEGMDTGPIILQAAVPVYTGDTRDELAYRIQMEEHRIYPEAVRLYQAGRLKIDGRRVIILPEEECRNETCLD
ncbi:phosphoribosylglycinamide formyltransferase [Anoxybacter fermentans]|uniref:Phosphoribosylglycinamide formyltransferase n=1 Tax=Anoxybacter fermentans TaxID=1323375 RepID=A0A3Q9HSD5_9FIRM|nr:phosphoribosylglycinamide formyltransferase [Anoxybacter fermentans]AZR74230.1 phosphoribosylglycinamide formyltransferase [Anoxybacter fermentans]